MNPIVEKKSGRARKNILRPTVGASYMNEFLPDPYRRMALSNIVRRSLPPASDDITSIVHGMCLWNRRSERPEQ